MIYLPLHFCSCCRKLAVETWLEFYNQEISKWLVDGGMVQFSFDYDCLQYNSSKWQIISVGANNVKFLINIHIKVSPSIPSSRSPC